MPIYKDLRLKEFAKDGTIELIEYEEFQDLYTLVRSPKWRAVLALLYFTGLRPIELGKLYHSNFTMDGEILRVLVSTAKSGRKREIDLPLKYPEVADLAHYIDSQTLPNQLVFPSLALKRSVRSAIRYAFKRYGVNIPAYFFRHNRMSLLSNRGASPEEIKYFKGAKSIRSVEPYLHISKKKARAMSQYI